jgi:thiol:disulfide interchange protein DsbD
MKSLVTAICSLMLLAANKPGTLTVAPAEVVHWSVAGANPLDQETVDVVLRLSTDRGFSLYEEKIEFTPPFGFSEVSKSAPAGTIKPDPVTGEPARLIDGGEFNVRFRGPLATLGGTLPFSVTYTACAEGVCLFPYTEKLTVAMNDVPDVPQVPPAVAETAHIEPGTGGEPVDFESGLARKLQSGTLSLWALLAIVFIGGLLTNLTPCVAPMIPITVRVLSGRDGHGLRNSSLYAAGILVTYTIAGVAAGLSGGLFGSILASAKFNLFFAAVMALLGITMLGYGNFSSLQNLGMKFGSGKPSILNMFLMGAGAGLVASPCTGPILAALLAYTAKSGSFVESVALIATYSLGFSLPYVFLGGAAAKVSKIKVNYRVQVGTKLLFASVMFALSLYYLRVPAYGLLQQIKPHFPWLSGVFAPVGVAMLIVWLAVPFLHNSKALSLAPAIVLAIGIFSTSQLYLSGSTSPSVADESRLQWNKDEASAYAAAKSSGKPVLVDAWAEWCDACKKMDVTTFEDPAVIDELRSNWVLLKLDLTEGSDENDALQDKYELQSLPTLTMVPPTGDLKSKDPVMGYTPAATLLGRLRGFREGLARQ